MLGFSDHHLRFDYWKLAVLATIAVFICGALYMVRAQEPGPMMFPTSDAACAAFLKAVQENDETALLQILGPNSRQIVSVGDENEDRASRQLFVEKYKEMHRLVREPDGMTATLYVGAENWPLPIALRHKDNQWYFDPVAGRQEILFRQIGRNELQTIEVCRELVSAEKEYFREPHDGGVKQYAARFYSDDGKHNGLYWDISNKERESPVGHLLALADTEYHERGETKPQPFHGYYYRILTRQGRHAPGGARNYLVEGRLTGGFAFVAYPAEYRSSGVMTFIVNQNGSVLQRDLGPQTHARARALTQYDPDSAWKKVE